MRKKRTGGSQIYEACHPNKRPAFIRLRVQASVFPDPPDPVLLNLLFGVAGTTVYFSLFQHWYPAEKH